MSAECRAQYVPADGVAPGARIVECGLPAGHYPQTCHEETDTGVQWYTLPDPSGTSAHPSDQRVPVRDRPPIAEWIRVRLAEAWPKLDADDPVFLDQVAHEAAFAVAPELAELREKLAAAERDRDALKAKLDLPCGSCHPCMNWPAETWKQAGRRLPDVHQYGEMFDENRRVRALHAPHVASDRTRCRGCIASYVPRTGELVHCLWPCPTINAMDAADAPPVDAGRGVGPGNVRLTWVPQIGESPLVDAGTREVDSRRSVDLSQVSAYVWRDPSGTERRLSPDEVDVVIAGHRLDSASALRLLADAPPTARTWALPDEPGPEVTAVRDEDGDLWNHNGEDDWELVSEKRKHRTETWAYVMDYAPLTDATGETPDA